MAIDCILCRGLQKACNELCMYTCIQSAGYSRFVLLRMYHFNFYHTMKYTLYSLQILVTCTDVELLLIHAICAVPRDWVLHQIVSPSSDAPQAGTAPSIIPLHCCKRYGGMLNIDLLPFTSTDSPLQIIGHISGS
jgi:hypothetical protein